jgi:hypothetical protein
MRAANSSIPARVVAGLVIGAMVTLLAAGCSEETKDQISDAVEEGGGAPGDGVEPAPPEETQPPPEATEPAPPEETAPAPPENGTETDEGLSSEDWLIIALIGVAGLAIIFGATALATNRSGSKQAARASLARRLGEISGRARWVHDQGSIDVLRVSDPDQLRSLWNDVRVGMVDLEGTIAALAPSVGDAGLIQSLSYLGQSIAGLRGALESNVALRLDPGAAGQAELLEQSNRAVFERRQQVQAVLTPIEMAQYRGAKPA